MSKYIIEFPARAADLTMVHAVDEADADARAQAIKQAQQRGLVAASGELPEGVTVRPYQEPGQTAGHRDFAARHEYEGQG